uniref:Uncharacterized protein n=1 Tax=Oryza brachyantha TaxID=4533 RepID=J3KUN8_ORYBR
MTFDEKFDRNDMAKWFYKVAIDPDLQGQSSHPPVKRHRWVNFFSYFASYNIKAVLNHVSEVHQNQKSYNGAFTSANIIFQNGAVSIVGIPTVEFTKDTCAGDFYKLYSIFKAKFAPHIPLYFDHLLGYLETCPDKANSNDEAIVAFIINHPCLQSYLSRMGQIEHLANMWHRHPGHSKMNESAMGNYSWYPLADSAPVLHDVFVYGPNGDAYFLNGTWYDLNTLYTDDAKGCLHFANNFLKHAPNSFMLHQVEAALSFNLKNFLPMILLNLARLAQKQPLGRQYIIDVLSNKLADRSTGN